MFLSTEKVKELTRRKQPAAQARVCRADGVPHAVDPYNGQILIDVDEFFGWVMGTRTDLYRHFDADGKLLYVGISLSALQRTMSHKHSGWWEMVTRIEIERHNTRDEALDAEREAIKTERPEFNKMHSVR